MKAKCLLPLVVLFLILGTLPLLPGPVWAQALTVTRVNDIDFGPMFPGVPKVVDKLSAEAIEFHVTGTPGAEITLDFALPEYMSVNGRTIQLIFYDNSCAVDTAAVPNQASPPFTDLNPWQTLTYRLGSNGLTVWLGAKAVPKLRQEAGAYTGDVVLTARYTGN